MSREVKFEIMFKVHSRDFTQSIKKHYTTIDRLTVGIDALNYRAIDVVAKRQFTGLHDKDGVDIYDGDILKTTSEILRPFDRSVKTRTGKYSTKYQTVEYRDGNACFCFVGSCITGISQKIISKYSVVAGNVYENPELTKES